MGSLGQVEGVQMESRQETPAALTVEKKEKALGEGREKSDRRKHRLYLFFLRRKNKTLCEEKQQKERGKSLSNELTEATGICFGDSIKWENTAVF